MSALSPTVELGASWPPLGITAINPFELPLLNTVESAINKFYINVAVWVKIPLYMLNLSISQVIFLLLLSGSFTTTPLFLSACGLMLLKCIKPQLNKPYSTNSIENDKEFYKWFSGFTDAEGNFMILTLPKGFTFKFSIGLHIDDLHVLNYIKDKLGFGIVYAYKSTCYFNVTKKEDILKIIAIFDIYTLNSSKRLDYLDLKKAFYLYNNRTSKEVLNQILDIKNSMNTQRINFKPSQVNISKSWLLGFIEGDGSFSLGRTAMEPVFSIKLTESGLPLLIEIKKYLENNLGFDSYSMQKLNSSSIIAIGKNKAINNSKPLATLTIKNIHFLNNYLIPFLNESGCKFISKKGLDFNDFKIICKAIYIGAHRIKRIKDLIIKLSFTMNNYRLSTYLGTVESISISEINEIINAKATIEHLSDGRQIDIETKKLIHRRSSSSIYKIIKYSGEILIKPNLAESAKELGIGFNTLKKQLENQIKSGVEYKGNIIKRIGVFQNKK